MHCAGSRAREIRGLHGRYSQFSQIIPTLGGTDAELTDLAASRRMLAPIFRGCRALNQRQNTRLGRQPVAHDSLQSLHRMRRLPSIVHLVTVWTYWTQNAAFGSAAQGSKIRSEERRV